MSTGDIKVTDKRLFTEDGELREEYRFLDQPDQERALSPAAPLAEDRLEEPAGPGRAPSSPPRGPAELRSPRFLDLVGLLAEPVTIYLGDAALPDGAKSENLELARFHIDLLEVLQQKTTGNLDPREQQVLEDLLYQLRLRYVDKRG